MKLIITINTLYKKKTLRWLAYPHLVVMDWLHVMFIFNPPLTNLILPCNQEKHILSSLTPLLKGNVLSLANTSLETENVHQENNY